MVFLSFCHAVFVILSYAVFVYLCICEFVFVYLCIWQSRISFLTSLNHQLFKNIAYVGYFGHFVICCICVFVYLCICICVFVYLTVQNIIFDVLGPLAFQKYSIIRVYKVFGAWWRQTTNDKRTNNRVNLEQVRSWTVNRADFCNCRSTHHKIVIRILVILVVAEVPTIK